MRIGKILLIAMTILVLAASIATVATAQSPDLKDFKFKNWGKYYWIDFSGKTYFAGYDNKCPFKDLSFRDKDYAAEVLFDINKAQTIYEGKSLPLKEDFELKIKSINLADKRIDLELLKAFRRNSFSRPTYKVVFSQSIKLTGGKPIDSTFCYVYPDKPSNIPYIHADPRELFEPRVVLIAVHFKEAVQEGTGSSYLKKAVVDGAWQISTNRVNICDLLNCEDGKDCTDDTCVSGKCNHVPDLNTDINNCGDCGKTCPPRLNSITACEGGKCSYKCNDGFVDCNNNPADGCEVNTNIDKSNCGSCGFSCDDNIPCTEDKCENGVCTKVDNCPDGKDCCYGTCVNLNGDFNCGECNKICPTCSYCDGGVCTAPITGKEIVVGEDATSIQDAVENKANDCDIIIVPAGTYVERVVIDKSLTILGAGEGITIVDGYYDSGTPSWIDSVFLIEDPQDHNVHVTLSGLSIQNGYFGIDNSASLTLSECNITGNAYCGIRNRKAGTSIPEMDLTHCNVTLNGFNPEYAQGGAGIYNEGLLSLTRSNITYNKAENTNGNGGGIYNQGGRAILNECNITGNRAINLGGGIFQGCGNTTIIETKIAHNQASYGGGIWRYSADPSCVYKVFGDLSQVVDNIGGDISP